MVVDDLSRLIAFPTISHRPMTELAAFLARRFEDLGFRIERIADPQREGKFNLIASIGPEGTDGLVMSGHMDVVPTEGQPWTSDPFKATLRDGKLYGRGTADMKGFFAATLQALARIAPADYQRELVLIWTHDEEIGCMGSAHLARTWAQEGRSLPAACLIGEPTGFQILRMHPGHAALQIEVFGKAAHSSRPDLGDNAIERAALVVQAVQQVALELEREKVDLPELERPWVAVNVARIHGGSAINIVPDRCLVDVGYRALPGMSAEAIFHRIRQAARAIAPDRIDAVLVRVTPSLLTPAGEPLEDLLRPFASTPVPGAASFATDGGNLAALGTRPLVFGPGRIEVAHQADEYVEVDELHRAVDVIEQVVRARCT